MCSDSDHSCCSTPPLKKTFSDDWSKNDKEEWGPGYLGNCSEKRFVVERGLNISLVKQGGDSLEVTSIFIETEIGTGKNKQSDQFKCGAWSSSGVDRGQDMLCSTSTYRYERVRKVAVVMGNDGTNDGVRVDICSDLNSVCCRVKLSSLISDDWSRNDEEVWSGSDLGECEDVRYKVESGLMLNLVKEGEDDLIVNKIRLETEDQAGGVAEYDCKGFTLQSVGQNCQGNSCQQSRLCSRQGGSIQTTRRTTSLVAGLGNTPSMTRSGGGLLAQAGFILGGRKTTATTEKVTTTRTTRAPFFG